MLCSPRSPAAPIVDLQFALHETGEDELGLGAGDVGEAADALDRLLEVLDVAGQDVYERVGRAGHRAALSTSGIAVRLRRQVSGLTLPLQKTST